MPGTATVTTLFSDHHAVEFEMRLSKPDAVKQQIHYRQLRRINHIQLRRDLEQLSAVTHPAVSLTALVEQYNTDLSELLERHAPLKSRFLTLGLSLPGTMLTSLLPSRRDAVLSCGGGAPGWQFTERCTLNSGRPWPGCSEPKSLSTTATRSRRTHLTPRSFLA